MSLSYKHVETALADALEVKPDGMGAFRARLRHLRNLGLPKLPMPGSGSRIGYSESQTFVMLIALELEGVGIAPRSAAVVAASIVRMHRSPRDILEAPGDGDVYIAVTPRSRKQWTALPTRLAFEEFLAKGVPTFTLLNLSICARTLDRALRDAEAQR